MKTEKLKTVLAEHALWLRAFTTVELFRISRDRNIKPHIRWQALGLTSDRPDRVAALAAAGDPSKSARLGLIEAYALRVAAVSR